MIDIKKVGPESIGKWVEYLDRAGKVERGKIKAWNDHVVFIVFSCNGEWNRFSEFTAAATLPADLTFRN